MTLLPQSGKSNFEHPEVIREHAWEDWMGTASHSAGSWNTRNLYSPGATGDCQTGGERWCHRCSLLKGRSGRKEGKRDKPVIVQFYQCLIPFPSLLLLWNIRTCISSSKAWWWSGDQHNSKYLQMQNQENIAFLEILNRDSDSHGYLWF